MNHEKASLLLIFVDETDTWGDSRVPLYEAVVEKLFEMGVDGATVHMGVMGFGAHRRLHRKGLFGVTDDRPVSIAVVDADEKLRGVLPALRAMVKEGMMFLTSGEIVQ